MLTTIIDFILLIMVTVQSCLTFRRKEQGGIKNCKQCIYIGIGVIILEIFAIIVKIFASTAVWLNFITVLAQLFYLIVTYLTLKLYQCNQKISKSDENNKSEDPMNLVV